MPSDRLRRWRTLGDFGGLDAAGSLEDGPRLERAGLAGAALGGLAAHLGESGGAAGAGLSGVGLAVRGDGAGPAVRRQACFYPGTSNQTHEANLSLLM